MVMVCGIFAGVQKQVIMHLDTSVLETYVMLLVLCKPSLGTKTRTLRSGSVHINILLSKSVNNFFMPIDWVKDCMMTSFLVLMKLHSLCFIQVNEGEWEVCSKVTALCIGNAKFFGGGMKITPNAHPSSGNFEVQIYTVLHNLLRCTVCTMSAMA